MSILTKSYEISVWDDVLEGGQFVEKRLGVIGSDKMIAQCRALEPTLTRNVNGTKKFSFKMYAQYIDNVTGEKIKNPFVDWLISERKVKLKYGNKWFDFIIKDIGENSSTHLYTYSLEDALVQELSKNGFGITLDAELMNNMGTAGYLGEKVLEETGWEVESEAFVEKVEEALIYIKIPENESVTKIIDQNNLSEGISTQQVTVETNGWQALAFYSSCTNKPHRFQFIYLPDGYSKEKQKDLTDENGVINVKDCQYYIDIAEPEDETNGYQKITETGLPTLYLPKDWSVVVTSNNGVGNDYDTTVSNWYRGARYGFAQQAEYIPLLGRYCQKFYHDPIDKWEWALQESATRQRVGGKYIFSSNGYANGIRIDKSYFEVGKTYTLTFKYKFLNSKDASTTTTVQTIGGHSNHYEQKSIKIDGEVLEGFSYGNGIQIPDSAKQGEHTVDFTFLVSENSDNNTFLYIQPNRNYTSGGNYYAEITIISCNETSLYYGYIDTKYDSPALLQNIVTNTEFKGTSGWVGTYNGSSANQKNVYGAKIESVYGTLADDGFTSVVDYLSNMC